MSAVTFTLSRPTQPKLPFAVGDKVKFKNEGRHLYPQRIKNKETVYRMLGKKFVPYLKITFVGTDIPSQLNVQLKPFNF